MPSDRTRYIPCVRDLLRQHKYWFLAATLAAILLRLLFVLHFPIVSDDSRIYADFSRNWLQHGVYGLTDEGGVRPSFTRLPGYPGFLTLVFAIFGTDRFGPVLWLQMLLDIGTCFLIADMARRIFSPKAARFAFLLAAICPFLANYAAAVLTETLEVFFTALTLDLAALGRARLLAPPPQKRFWASWLGCGAAAGMAILLRPDGGLLPLSAGLYLLWTMAFHPHKGPSASLQGSRSPRLRRHIAYAGLLFAAAALLPLLPWTVRNLRTLHRLEPLAPRYANEPDEYVPMGFNRWVKTWVADYTSVQEIYWNVPAASIDADKLPGRTFDSDEQKRQTLDAFAQYNQSLAMTPDIDARFADLARERIQARPLRYYLWLPMLRIADMWLRPRTELLPADPRWWEFNDDLKWEVVSVLFGLINLIYVVSAAWGYFRLRRSASLGLLILFLLLRSLFLGSLENPEPRYTLEAYPVIIVLSASLWHKRPNGRQNRSTVPAGAA